jgi:hypothetical protein
LRDLALTGGPPGEADGQRKTKIGGRRRRNGTAFNAEACPFDRLRATPERAERVERTQREEGGGNDE